MYLRMLKPLEVDVTPNCTEIMDAYRNPLFDRKSKTDTAFATIITG